MFHEDDLYQAAVTGYSKFPAYKFEQDTWEDIQWSGLILFPFVLGLDSDL